MKRGRKENKKGVMELPFSVIFAIILIVVFIVVAFYVVRHFLCIGDETKSGMFLQDFQDDVDEAWNSPDINKDFSYNVPRIDYVCFMDFSKSGKGEGKEIYDGLIRYEGQGNLFLYPESNCVDLSKEIEHIDMEKITGEDNPYCIEVESGKVVIHLEKGFYDNLVCVGEKCESSSSGGGSVDEGETTQFCGISTQASCNLNSDCKEGGCSGQVCEAKNESIVTICDYKDCYNADKYGLSCKCVSGKCKWD